MKRVFLLLVAAVLGVIAVISFLRAGKAPVQPAPGKFAVAATIYPLYDIARNVMGNAGTARGILPPGASPHVFEFSPGQVRALQDVRLIFAIGHGLDNWSLQMANAVKGPRVVVVDREINLRTFTDGSQDPHYWLHFGNAQKIADNIARALSEADSAHAETYLENARAYKQALAQKERELNEGLRPARGTPILTFHDAWQYFAEDFGLTIAGTFQPSAGEEPSPRYFAQLQKKIKAGHIDVIFIEPQLSTGLLEAFAQDTGVNIAELDPLGGVEGRDTYLALMEFNARSVLQATRKRGP